MPFPTFRTFVGVAKDSINAQLSAKIAAAVTSLPIQNTIGTTGTLTTSGATYTAIIFDGANTETVACSGNLAAGAIPCAATANAHSANCYVAFQLTASVGPTNYIPIETFTPNDEVTQLIDKSLRGYAGETYGIQPGNRKGSWDVVGTVFPDTFGYICGAHFGSDVVTGASPYTHTFATNNAGTYQPAHYLLYALNGYNTRVFAGSICTDIVLTFDPAQFVKYNAKFITRASGVLSTPTQSFSGITPVPSWQAAITLAGTATGKLKTLDATFTRTQSAVVDALTGNQDPYALFAGPQTLTGKFVAVKEDDGVFNYYAGVAPLTQPVLKLALTVGTGPSQTGIVVQASQAALKNVIIKLQGQPFVEEECEFEGVMNATDANTGQAPGQIQLINAVASATTYV